MAGGHNPGSSLRCKECKQRRKKCDLQRPRCLRCRQSGLSCSGPREAGSIFVNRDTEAFESQTQRGVLVAAYKDRDAVTGSRHVHDGYQSVVDDVEYVRVMVEQLHFRSTLTINDTILSVDAVSIQPTYSALLEEFSPSREVGIFSGDRTSFVRSRHYSSIASCIRSLLPLASLPNTALQRSILSLLALYYGRLHGHAGLVEFARSTYGVALNIFRQEISSLDSVSEAERARWRSLLAFVAMSLQIFEHLNEVDVLGASHYAHVNGTLELLQQCGPDMVSGSLTMKQALSGIRGVAVFVSIEHREHTFLATRDWSVKPFLDTPRSAKDKLNDLALDIPALLQATDRLQVNILASTNGQSHLIDRGLSLINKTSALLRRFESWLYDLKALIDRPLFANANQPTTNFAEQGDMECRPRFKENLGRLMFHSGPVAGLLFHFWSFRLQLLMNLIDIQQALHRLENITEQDATGTTLLSDTLLQGLSRNRWEAEETANLMVEAEPYLTSCLEGLLCIQLPARILAAYYETKPESTIA